MNAISVCVDYADILAITLPRNRHYFDEYVVVTSHNDESTVRLCAENNVICYQTDAFYRFGAMFNKGLAMEEGFNILGRRGWLCILDADIVLPDDAVFSDAEIGKLYSPYRHLLAEPKQFRDGMDWSKLTVRHESEHAGYCTYFHAKDYHLTLPWYGIGWTHAGGCDSEFSSKWPIVDRYRPDWKVLHLGPTDVNWCGRVTDLEDQALAQERAAQMYQVMHTYRRPELNIPQEAIHVIGSKDRTTRE